MFLKFSDVIKLEEYTLTQLANTLNNIKSNENAEKYKEYIPLQSIIQQLKFDTPSIVNNIKSIIASLQSLRKQKFIKTDEEYNAYINALKYCVITNYDTLNTSQKIEVEKLFNINKEIVEKLKEQLKNIKNIKNEEELIKKLNSIFSTKEKISVVV